MNWTDLSYLTMDAFASHQFNRHSIVLPRTSMMTTTPIWTFRCRKKRDFWKSTKNSWKIRYPPWSGHLRIQGHTTWIVFKSTYIIYLSIYIYTTYTCNTHFILLPPNQSNGGRQSMTNRFFYNIQSSKHKRELQHHTIMFIFQIVCNAILIYYSM